MRILFITQYYPPETGAAANRLSHLVEALGMSGHTVTVLTAMPNYPRGEVFQEYRGRLLKEERIGPTRLIRTWIYATRKNGFWNRLASYFSFMISSFVGALLKVKTQDVLIVESPPLFLGIPGVILSWLWRSRLVFNVSDLWPQTAIDLGVLHNRLLIRLSTTLEEVIYRQADLITGQTQGIVSNIQRRVSRTVLLYTNGVNPSALTAECDRDQVRHEAGFSEDAFLVGYTGLHGLGQALDTVLSAAEQMSDCKEVFFVFWGDGPEKPRLERLAQEKKLSNVRFFSTQPRERMPKILSALDVAVVPLRRLNLFKAALPNKLFESMGAGVPVVVSIEGEAKSLVERAGGGICIPPEDANALMSAILVLYKDPELRQSMGHSARQFMAANYDRRFIAQRVEQALLQLFPKVQGVAAHPAVEGNS